MESLNRIKTLAGIKAKSTTLTESVSSSQIIDDENEINADNQYNEAMFNSNRSGLTVDELIGLTDDELTDKFVSGQIDRDTYEETIQAQNAMAGDSEESFELGDDMGEFDDEESDEFAAQDDEWHKDLSYTAPVQQPATPQAPEEAVAEEDSPEISRMRHLAGISPVDDMVAKFKSGEIDYNKLQQFLNSGPDEETQDSDDYTDYSMRQGEMGNPNLRADIDTELEEAGIDTGYKTTDVATDDYFPNGADRPVAKAVGPSGARHGDNPEQRKMQVAEAHRDLVRNYRNFLAGRTR